jgi:hypothetical protein
VRGPVNLTAVNLLWNFTANELFRDGLKFVKIKMTSVFTFHEKEKKAINIDEMDNITQEYSQIRFNDMKQSNPYTSRKHGLELSSS